MHINRRQFLKYCIASASALGLGASVVNKLEEAVAGDSSLPTIIWLEGSSCSGCSVSLANLIGDSEDGGPTDVADLLINYLNTAFAKTFMSATGDLAVSNLQEASRGDFILVTEGGVPTAFDGHVCTIYSENGQDVTMQQAITELAPQAAAVISVGTCASFGGIPAAEPNPAGVVTVQELTGINTINIPGCPVHPDWLTGTIASLLCGEVPDTDEYGRPMAFFSRTICSQCPRKPMFDQQRYATAIGQEGRCMYLMGCNGPTTFADCPTRGWNNGMNYCPGTNAPCIGCVESDFPKNQLLFR